jgi:hypothetical protein
VAFSGGLTVSVLNVMIYLFDFMQIFLYCKWFFMCKYHTPL